MSEDALHSVVFKARALVIPFEGDVGLFRARARRSKAMALDHGLGIIFCAAKKTDSMRFAAAAGGLVEKFPRHRTKLMSYGWSEIAEWIARYEPGPDSETYPQLVGARSRFLPPEDTLLLRRAFSDFERVGVRELSPGYSGARVAVVHPIKPRPGAPVTRLLPYVVKFGERDRIAGEREKYEQHIVGKLPFAHRPNIDERRCVEGKERALLTQDFVDAVPLSDVAPGGNPFLLLASLFEGALRECRLSHTQTSTGIIGALDDLGVLNWTNALDEAARVAIASFGAKRTASKLRVDMQRLPNVPFVSCTVHGDLHAGNVFVAAASPHVILIDFAKAEFGPIAADPAALEVSLAFPAGSREFDAPRQQMLDRLYMPPLRMPTGWPPPGSSLGSSWLWEALRGIRLFARAIEPLNEGSDPYSAAVACYLLRFASYEDNFPVKRRAMAYRLAERLLF